MRDKESVGVADAETVGDGDTVAGTDSNGITLGEGLCSSWKWN